MKALPPNKNWAVYLLLDKGVEASASLAHSHYAMECAQIGPKDDGVWLAASDGHQAIVRPCTGHADKTYLVPVHPLAEGLDDSPGWVYLDGKWFSQRNGRYAEPVPDRKFPDVSGVLPKIGNDCVPVTITVGYLMKIAKAIGEQGIITMFVPKTRNKPIAIIGTHGIGAVMPEYQDEKTEGMAERYTTMAEAFAKAPKT